MGRYIIRRLLQAIVLLLIVSIVTFMLIHSAPGGPSLLANPDLTTEELATMTENLGLNDPLPVQYVRWLGHVLQGDLGTSYNNVEPVDELILDRLPNTLLLTGVGLLLSIAIAIPLGILSAVRRNSILDRGVTAFSFLGVSVPVFWLGIMLIILFSVRWDVFPAGGMYSIGDDFSLVDRLKHLFLPMLVVVTANLAGLVRYTRSGMITVLSEDYIRTARAKGLTNRRVIFGHALRNALVPVITVIGISLPNAVSGAAITETVFSWPGMGLLAVNAAKTRDYPVVLGTTLAVAVVVIFSSLITDLIYARVDPRIRLE
jgi:peptide/nickel transport system permease protein